MTRDAAHRAADAATTSTDWAGIAFAAVLWIALLGAVALPIRAAFSRSPEVMWAGAFCSLALSLVFVCSASARSSFSPPASNSEPSSRCAGGQRGWAGPFAARGRRHLAPRRAGADRRSALAPLASCVSAGGSARHARDARAAAGGAGQSHLNRQTSAARPRKRRYDARAVITRLRLRERPLWPKGRR